MGLARVVQASEVLCEVRERGARLGGNRCSAQPLPVVRQGRIADKPRLGVPLRTSRGRSRLARQVRKGQGSFESIPRDFVPCRLAKAVREAFGETRSPHSGAFGHRKDVRCRLVTVLQPRRDACVTKSRNMPTERRVEFMRLQNRRPRLPPSLPVDLGGQRSSVVENEHRVIRAEIAPDGLLLQDRRQLAADGNTPYGARAVQILLAAVLCLRVDQKPTGAVFCEFHVSNAQRQGFLRVQCRESDGGQEGP